MTWTWGQYVAWATFLGLVVYLYLISGDGRPL